MTATSLLVLILIAALIALGVRLAVLIATDGRGHRPPPRSHHDWTQDVPGIGPRWR